MFSLSESQSAYLAALAIMLISSFIVRKIEKMNFPLSLVVLSICFSLADILYLFGTIILNLCLLYTIRRYPKGKLPFPSQYLHTIICFGSIILFKCLKKDNQLDISGCLMLLCIKFFYLAVEFDGNNAILINYLFATPGILTGPVPSYKCYSTTKKEKNYHKGLRNLILSFLFLGLHVYVSLSYDYKILLETSNLFKKIAYLFLIGIGHRSKYYFCWLFSYSCFIFAGYPNYKNIFPLKCEFAKGIKDLNSSWNVCTNQWLKELVFVPLKGKGYFYASLCTFLVSALWHGIHITYFIMFISITLCVPLLNNNELAFKKCFGRFYIVACVIEMSFFINYFMIPFFVFELDMVFKIWKALYYYGHVFVLLSLIHILMVRHKNKK